jgi:DNA end-binding protein Ku
MALRPTWKGALKLRLISIPIRVYPATDPHSSTAFRQLHRKCHTPIQLKKWCPVCDREVANDEIVRGYEVNHGHYVLLGDKEIKSAKPAATHTVELGQVIPQSALDPLLLERAYFLAPETKAAGEPFAVIREALGDRAGIGRLAIYGREYLVAVAPKDEALVMYTLRERKAVRSTGQIPDLELAHRKIKADELKLARQVLGSLTSGKTLNEYTDHYRTAIATLVEKKLAQAPAIEVGAPTGDREHPKKVVNLMEALRQSLERAGHGTRPARGVARKPAKVLAHPAHRAHKVRRAS